MGHTNGLNAYYKSKIEELGELPLVMLHGDIDLVLSLSEGAIRDKGFTLQRLEAQRNELNSNGESLMRSVVAAPDHLLARSEDA